MFLFYLKKNFYDGWDNVGQMVVVNLIILLYSALMFFAVGAASNLNTGLGFLVFVAACAGFAILVMAYGENAAAIANYETRPVKEYFSQIKSCAKDGFLFGALCGLLISACFIGIPGYLSFKTTLGFILAVILFWTGVISVLAFQWFIPLRSLMHNDFKKCLKKCFLIFFDNTGFSIAMALYTLVMLLLSVFCVGFVPSYAGIILARTNALRLRLYKYDYLEAHPELETPRQRKSIPWEELIYEDRETLGPHKLKTIFFPWKN